MKELARRVRTLEGGSSGPIYERWLAAMAAAERGEEVDFDALIAADPGYLARLEKLV